MTDKKKEAPDDLAVLLEKMPHDQGFSLRKINDEWVAVWWPESELEVIKITGKTPQEAIKVALDKIND